MSEPDFAHPQTRGRPRGKAFEPQRNAYDVASLWTSDDPRIRRPRSRQAASAYKSIANIPPTWGRRLDALGANHRQLRWLAGTMGHGFAAAREARYAALVTMLEENPRDAGGRAAAFDALRASMPTVRQRRGRETA